MGLLPDMLPGYTPIGPIDTGDPGSRIALEYKSPTTPGLDLLQIFDAAAAGNLSALYVVGANPVARYDVDPAALKDTFVVVQEMFLTETAALADVVLPAANLYEKSGSVTNSYGDLQQVKKAADRAGVRSDFEMIVRIADKMGADVRKLVPFGAGVRADMGQTRGAESGEADRHAVWLTANNMEPRLSPFDPSAPSSTRSSASSPATISITCNCSPATISTSRPQPRRCATTRAWCRSANDSTWCCRPTIRSSPPVCLAVTPRSSTSCNATSHDKP